MPLTRRLVIYGALTRRCNMLLCGLTAACYLTCKSSLRWNAKVMLAIEWCLVVCQANAIMSTFMHVAASLCRQKDCSMFASITMNNVSSQRWALWQFFTNMAGPLQLPGTHVRHAESGCPADYGLPLSRTLDLSTIWYVWSEDNLVQESVPWSRMHLL